MKLKRSRILLIIGGIVFLWLVVLPIGSQVVKYVTLSNKSNAQFSLADQHTTDISRQLQAVLVDYKLVKPPQTLARCSSDDPFNTYYTCYRGVSFVMKRNTNDTTKLDVTHGELQNFMAAHNGVDLLRLSDLNDLKDKVTQHGYWTSTYTLSNTGIPGVPQTDKTTATQTADLKIRMVIYNPQINKQQGEGYRADYPGQNMDYYSGVDTTSEETLLVVTYQKYDACSYDLFVCPNTISHFSLGRI